ncbi:MAG: hypothetical protein KBC30_06610 [Planctomycetes bacterium]|nr:hypothetical protein [Planctomycetota bacterium]
MADLKLTITDEKKIRVEIADKKCEIPPQLYFSDIAFIYKTLENSFTGDFRSIVAAIIVSRTEGVFEFKEIYNLDNSIFDKYIEICVNEEDTLRKNYELSKITDNNEKFVRAILQTGIEVKESLSKSLKNFVKNFSQEDESSEDSAEKIESVKIFVDSGWEYLSELSRSLLVISSWILKSWIKIMVSWGKYGWTIPPEMPLQAYIIAPKNSKNAYNMMEPYISDNHMERVFDMLRKMENINDSNLNEVIECFKSKHYTGCAGILFPMIDSMSIRYRSNEKQKAVCLRAIKKYFGSIKLTNIEEIISFILYKENIFTALKIFFKHGDDFKNEPEILNRNFLLHGMMDRDVTKEDCIKLFLLLYNFTQFMNFFDEKKDNC